MQRKLVIGLVPGLLLGAVIFFSADARPPAGNVTWPLSLISRPCASISLQGPGSGPPRVVCRGVTGRDATITIPTVWLSDRAPELSLVGIPTFFNLEWDPQAEGAQDSRPLTMSDPIGSGATDKLVNVRVQLRLRAVDAVGASSESLLSSDNVTVGTSDNLFLLEVDERGVVSGDHAGNACTAGTGSSANALLLVEDKFGGYRESGGVSVCEYLQGRLGKLVNYDPGQFIVGFRDIQRYLDWPMLSMDQFLSYSPFASIYGGGTDHASPAFQISASTRFQLEARVVWDEHEVRTETRETDCQWSYYDDYDFIDWGRWPDPIFCREEVIVEWDTFCLPFGNPACVYGHPDNWWIPYIPQLEVTTIRRPDGTYGTTYDFVSVQAQALLTSP